MSPRIVISSWVRSRLFSLVALLPILLIPLGNAEASPSKAQLEARVEQLESQNREILETLKALQEVLQERTQPTEATAEAPAPPARLADESTKKQPVRAGNSLEPYGFVRIDFIGDDSLPSNAQTPFFIRSPDNPGGGDPNFTLHPRLTRLGLRVHGPELATLAGSKLAGRIEVDFQNGGSESREIIRIRHAYIELEHGDWSLLAGQTWDVISPLLPTANNDTLMWNAGNLGDRRPQFRVDYHPSLGGGELSLVGALGLGGAINARDLDGDGVRDGEASAQPNYQGRLGYSHSLWRKDAHLTLGAWGHYAREKSSSTVGGKSHFEGLSAGIDYDLSLSEALRLRGEAFYGKDLPEFRGGIGQGVNSSSGREIESRGGWSELALKLNTIDTVYCGFGIDDPDNSDLEEGARTRNRVWWIGNRLRLAPALLVGLDYLRWSTDFDGLRRGRDNRVNLYFQYDL